MSRHHPLAWVAALALALPAAGLGCATTPAPATEEQAARQQARVQQAQRAGAEGRVQEPGEFEADGAAEERFLSTRVYLGLLQELGDDAFQIAVEAKGDDIVLSGSVDDPRLRREAIAVAQGIEGVDQVSANLIVPERDVAEVQDLPLAESTEKQARSLTDELLATGLELQVLGALGTDAVRVDVEVVDGEVVLQGYVPEREDALRAEEVVRGSDGVRTVDNRLLVEVGAGG